MSGICLRFLFVFVIALYFSCSFGQSAQFSQDAQFQNQPALFTINAQAAGYAGITGHGVKIGQLDTGITATHVAFTNAISAGINASTGVVGINPSNIADAGAPFDHGTLVASVMAARRNGLNLPGNMQGLAYNAQLVEASSWTNFLSSAVYSTSYNKAADQLLANAVNYVANQGVKVINNSYGFYVPYSQFQNNIPLTLAAYANASKNAVMVFAAGNDSLANTASPNIALPAALPFYNSTLPKSWISVVATTVNGQSIARDIGVAYPNYPSLSPSNPALTYANYCGVTAAYCVSAPGGYALQGAGGASYNANIPVFISPDSPLLDGGITGAWGMTNNQFYSTLVSSQCGSNPAYNCQGGSGSSFASALTSATVALVAQVYPWMTPEQLAATVLTTASHASDISLIDGRGMINVGAAIKGPAIFETDFVANLQGSSSVFGNNISGNAGLVMNGPGSLTLTGNETYAGNTTINSGTLIFNGSGPTLGAVSVNTGGVLQVGSTPLYSNASIGGNVTIQNGGILLGYGSVGGQGSTVVNNGYIGISSSGAQVGSLKIGGNYSQSGAGTYQAFVVNGAADLLRISKNAYLNGGLNVIATSPIVQAGKFSLVNSAGIVGKFSAFNNNLSAYTPMPYGLSYDLNNVYLTFTPLTANTYSALQNNANAIASSFASQSSLQFSGLNYDCNMFGANNFCFSAGGRATQASSSAQGYSSGGGLLIGSYRFAPTTRVGLWVDEGFNPSGVNVRVSNGNPMIGIFSTYAPTGSINGPQITGALSYVTNNATITRPQLMYTESGSGNSLFSSAAAQIQYGYGFSSSEDLFNLMPFVAIRYYSAKFGGYGESGAAFPITYNASKMNANTGILGLKFGARLNENWGAYVNAGAESDLSRSNPTMTGTSQLTGLNYFGAQPSYASQNTRPYAGAGINYFPSKREMISLGINYQQDFYVPISTTTTRLTYTIAL